MGGKSGGNEAKMARQDEQARQERIRQGTTEINRIFDGNSKEVQGVFGGFNDDFFNNRRQAFIDYASPQLNDQYADAQKELTFALARGGNLDSSVRGQQTADLQKQYDLANQQIADQAISYEKDARNSVEDARSNLIATLNATGDVQGAVNSSLARATALSQPQAFSPLANLFADFTAGLGTQAALERANAYSGGMIRPRYNTGLFSPNPNSVQVT